MVTIWERAAPTHPLTECECQLVEWLAQNDVSIDGLALCVDGDGAWFVMSYLPPADESAPNGRLSLAQLEEAGWNWHAKGDLARAEGSWMLLLRLRLRRLGAEHPDALGAAANLSRIRLDEGKAEEAREIIERVCAVSTSALGPEHESTLASQSARAFLLGRLGDSAGQREVQESVYATRKRVLGEDDPLTLVSGFSLAGTLSQVGEWVAARTLYQSVHTAQRRLFGIEDRLTLASAGGLAAALRALGDLSAAHALLEEVLEIQARVLGAEHPHALKTAMELAKVKSDRRDLGDARKLSESTYEAWRRTAGPDHLQTLISADLLAGVMRDQGDLAESKRLLAMAHETGKRALGEEHWLSMRLGNNLAVTLRENGERSAAGRIHQLVYETCLRTLGPSHHNTLRSAANFAEALSDQGDLAGARKILEWACETSLRVLGPGHPTSLECLNDLAEVFRLQGDLLRARGIHEQVYSARLILLGKDHTQTLSSASNLAACASTHTGLAAGRELLASVYEELRQKFGPDHPLALKGLGNLAAAMQADGDLSGAINLEESIAEKLAHALGPAHPSTIAAICSLSESLAESDDLAACAAVSLKAMESLLDAPAADPEAWMRVCLAPPFAQPQLAWPAESIVEFLDLAPAMSRRLVSQLRAASPESHAPIYAALVRLQERWMVFASHHLPVDRHPEAILSAVSLLHGPAAWAQLRGTIAARSWDDGRSEVTSYLRSERAVELAYVSYQQAEQDCRTLRQRRSDLRHQLALALDGDAPGREMRANSLQEVLRAVQLELRDTMSALEELAKRFAKAESERDESLEALAGSDSDVAQRLRFASSTYPADLQASLAPGDLWLVPLPDQHIVDLEPDPRLWPLQAESHHSPVYAMRHGHNPVVVEFGSLQVLAAATTLYRQAVSWGGPGQIRGATGQRAGIGEIAASEDGPREWWLSRPDDALGLAKKLSASLFWRPLSLLLEGTSRVMLVTGPRQHDIMFECGQPHSMRHLQLHRYCGLPAYGRRMLDDAERMPTASSKSGASPGFVWVNDRALDSTSPIPFTELDALIPRLRGLGEPQEAEDLQRNGPRRPFLLLACHGQTSGSDENACGSITLGRWHLDPGTLTLRSKSWRPMQALVALSCFAGVVGTSDRGDAHGVIAALQAGGLRWAIACLAPVPDFTSPMLAALLHHHLDTPRAEPSRALIAARQQLVHGPWDDDVRRRVMDPLRENYKVLMLQLLRSMRYLPGDPRQNAQARPLLRTLGGWSLTDAQRRALQPWRALLGGEGDPGGDKALQLDRLHRELSGWLGAPDRAEAFVEECLGVLFKEPSRRNGSSAYEDASLSGSLEHLCAVTVLFGGSDASWPPPRSAVHRASKGASS